jgi:membrane-associated phospholipid phosphatase
MQARVVIFLLLSCAVSLHAQPDSTGFPAVVGKDVETAAEGALHLFSAPVRWTSCDWGKAGGAIGVTVGCAFLDKGMRSAVQPPSETTTRIADAAEVYGNGWFAFGITAGAYGTALIVKDRWLRETAVLAGTAIVISTIATRILKPIVGRGRPYLNSGNTTFHLFSFNDDHNSFPSGHTIAAFSLSSVLAARIDKPIVTIGLYALAGLTGLSRVYTDQHWFSDVVFGGIFASAVGRSLVIWHENNEAVQGSLQVLPAPGQIQLVYTF